MEITRDKPKFRPLHLHLLTQDDLDKLLAIVSAVAENRINHTQPIIRTAVDLRRIILEELERE